MASAGPEPRLRRPLLGAPVAGSIAGLYYYLRLIVAMTVAPPAAPRRTPSITRRQGAPLGKAVLAALVLLVIGLGAPPARS